MFKLPKLFEIHCRHHLHSEAFLKMPTADCRAGTPRCKFDLILMQTTDLDRFPVIVLIWMPSAFCPVERGYKYKVLCAKVIKLTP